MRDRIKTVLIVQTAVNLVLLAVAAALALTGAPAWAGLVLAVILVVGIPAWLLAAGRYARLAIIVDLGLWAIGLALVWRWVFDWGAGPGVLLLALPIVGMVFALAEPASAWWMAGFCSVVYLAAALIGLSLPSDYGNPWADMTTSLLYALAGIWGTAGLAWALGRIWRRDTDNLSRQRGEAQAQVVEQARLLAEMEQMASDQAARLDRRDEWSPVVMTVYDRIVVLPLGGTLDEDRARQAREALLQAIARQRAKVALIDVTHLPAVDAGGAARLKTMVMAGRLVGAEVALTGIGPKLASSLIATMFLEGNRADMQALPLTLHPLGLEAHHDLQSGIEWALERMGRRIVTNPKGRQANG